MVLSALLPNANIGTILLYTIFSIYIYIYTRIIVSKTYKVPDTKIGRASYKILTSLSATMSLMH